MSGFIEFQNVTKEYINGDEVLKAVNNLNFTIDKGEFVVILGPSGSGKSTLLNLLGGLDHVSSGNIMVNSHDITGYSDNDLTEYRAHEVGFIFQFYNLIPNLTALENLELISDVIGRKIDGKSMLDRLNLTEHYHNFPSELSGGEQQRVSIARALVKNPNMLLCDEPTGALDSNTGDMVIELLYDICKNNKTTVIIVTHNEDIASLADKVIHLKNGIIESIDTKLDDGNADSIDAEEVLT
ncbi:MAG: ABC transporter ATP-binding protein [Methanobrevibacter boviskoreani]|uniref:ABC transporter ATP-binding protein n=1 Tax=Methanobrevibacter boviskoreani TaxID=1348249 RepID=UPI0023A83503|nr:ABC transporter ATP-binding protein [Methanobrevibacter boviskoreani]MCI6930737.1 ABC transporter ATP-binding protein [Methanobrevibacter boviskoreani]